MAPRNPLPALVAGLAIAALVAVDAVPALRGAPLLLLVLAAGVQIGRELASALARRDIFPSAPTMNFVTALVVLHVAYFRTPGVWSTMLELANTVVLAMFTLVLAAAVWTDIKGHGLIPTLRFGVVALAITVVFGGGLSTALLVEVMGVGRVSPEGARLVALLLAAAWAGLGLARRWEQVDGQPSYRVGSPVALLVRLVLPAAIVALGVPALGLPGVTVAGAAGLGFVVGVGCLIGFEVVRRLAVFCDVETFRFKLPHQVEFMQPLYDRLFSGGLTDYAGPLAVVYALAWLYLGGQAR